MNIKLFEEFINEIYSRDLKLNAFLELLSTKGLLQHSPLNRGEFIYNNIASLEFSRFDKGDRNEILFSDIMVLDKGQGHGKKILKDIVDTADELEYTITLDAKPFGNDAKRLDIKGLVYFYSSFGFKIDLTAYDNSFKTDKAMIKYAEKYGESIPMYRKPKHIAEGFIDDFVRGSREYDKVDYQKVTNILQNKVKPIQIKHQGVYSVRFGKKFIVIPEIILKDTSFKYTIKRPNTVRESGEKIFSIYLEINPDDIRLTIEGADLNYYDINYELISNIEENLANNLNNASNYFRNLTDNYIDKIITKFKTLLKNSIKGREKVMSSITYIPYEFQA